MQSDKKIANFNVTSKNLESYYKSVEDDVKTNGHANGNHNNNNNNNLETVDLRKARNGATPSPDLKKELSTKEIVFNLLHKRFLHFKRNYRLMICILLLPVIFEVIAMGFMKIRPPGDYDNDVEFNRSMYPKSYEFYSKENDREFGNELYDDFSNTCSLNGNCEFFNSSKDSFNWILKTHEEYIQRRYGGISINNSRSIVWYNNKGYHSMPLYLNQLDSAILRKELNHSSYSIRAYNAPLKLGEDELSVSSM